MLKISIALIVLYTHVLSSDAFNSFFMPSSINPMPRDVTSMYITTSFQFVNINNRRRRAPDSKLQAESETSENRPSTLYEILNSEQDATRSELKRNYVKLVKQSHPDALISSGGSSSADSEEQFQKITSAWKTLSNPLDRKRYDRELRAQAFTQNVEDIVGNIATTAGPQFIKAFDNVAIPFLRRSAATTVAGFTAVQKDIQNYGDLKSEEGVQANGTNDGAKVRQVETNERDAKGLGSILSNAVMASQKAGKAIDRLELNEKSMVLSKSAKEDMKQATKLRDRLDRVMRKRVQLLLHCPDAKLTSLEALIILDGFNIKDEVTMLDTVRLRKTVTEEIEWLEPLEKDFANRKELDKKHDVDLERKVLALDRAQTNAVAALQAEERARKALEDAIALVESTKADVDDISTSLSSITDEKNFNLSEIDKVQFSMERQQERVRLALRRKEQILEKGTNKSVLEPLDTQGEGNMLLKDEDVNYEEELNIVGDFDNEKAAAVQQQIKELLKKEQYLKAESARLEAKAERSLSRAEKLVDRADELEQVEEEAYKAFEEGLRVAKNAADGGYGQYGEN